MMEIIFSQPTEAALEHIAANMREMDKFECRAFGQEPLEALHASVRDSRRAVVFSTNEPIGIYGYLPWNGTAAIFWLLGTPGIRAAARSFLLHSRRVRDELLREYSALTNVVCTANLESMRWLTHLGAEFEKDAEYVYDSKPFKRFYIRR